MYVNGAATNTKLTNLHKSVPVRRTEKVSPALLFFIWHFGKNNWNERLGMLYPIKLIA